MHGAKYVSTFSIVARDPATGDLGVAVASKFLAVGAVVPWARAGVGAVATQALANVTYGPRGLELLATGRTAPEVVEALTVTDPERDQRQVGIVDASGNAASTVRRTPCTSTPMPIASCSAPNAKWNIAANSPSPCAERPKSPCSAGAMIAATVR